MNKIIFADGTEVIDGSITLSGDNQIYVSIPGTNIVEAVQLLTDTNKIKEMTCYFSVFKRIYKGFTHLSSVGIDDRGKQIQAYMTGSETSVEESYTVPEIYLPEEMRKKEEQKENADGSEENDSIGEN